MAFLKDHVVATNFFRLSAKVPRKGHSFTHSPSSREP